MKRRPRTDPGTVRSAGGAGRLGTALAVLLLAAPAAAAGDEPTLPRRGDLGLTTSDQVTGDSVVIIEVEPGGPADRAGLRRGDQITGFAGERVRAVESLWRGIAHLGEGEVARLGVRHGPMPTVDGELLFSARAFPLESVEDLRLEYGAFRSGELVLRSLVTRPADGEGPWPAVLLIPDFLPEACDEPGPNPQRELSHELARRGVLVMRYDPRGTGDSQGPPWAEVGFDAERDDARAALGALLARGDVDRARVVLFGRGPGATVAALVADARPEVAGVAGWGIRARSIMEWYIDITRYQQDILDVPPASAARIVDVLSRTMGGVISGAERDSFVARVPEAAGLWAPDGRLFGKLPAYWSERNDAPVFEAWSRVRGPVLLLRGEFDVYAPEIDPVLLSRALTTAYHPRHETEELPGLDQDFGRVASDREATLRFRAMDRSADGATDLAGRLTAWMETLPAVTAITTPAPAEPETR